MDSEYRPRRTCMSVPASSERFLAKARDLAADEVMLDLEDSVAPAAKDMARGLAVAALRAADFMASIGMRSLTVGGQPAGYDFDAHSYPLMRILVAARASGLQAIDGPYARIQDTDGLRKAATSVAALGYDGKWVLHPAQVPVVNEVFTPSVDEYWRALGIVAAYDKATSLDQRGAVMLGDEMIDEASRKMALALVARGDAAGLPRPAH